MLQFFIAIVALIVGATVSYIGPSMVFASDQKETIFFRA